jgi:hypothetical protein
VREGQRRKGNAGVHHLRRQRRPVVVCVLATDDKGQKIAAGRWHSLRVGAEARYRRGLGRAKASGSMRQRCSGASPGDGKRRRGTARQGEAPGDLNRRHSGGLGIRLRCKTERGARGELAGVLTGVGDGWRRPESTRATSAASCSSTLAWGAPRTGSGG